MSTTPIRFLLVSESLEDRSLGSILRHEGHEVGYLVPEDSDLSRYPLPPNTPVMTTPAMAVDMYDPAVIVFPSPYVGELAQQLIRDKRWVVGSSTTHHQLATMDPRFGRALAKTAGLKHSEAVYIEDDADFQHALLMLDAYEDSDTSICLSYSHHENYYAKDSDGIRAVASFVRRPRGVRMTVVKGKIQRTRSRVLFFSGKQALPVTMDLCVLEVTNPGGGKIALETILSDNCSTCDTQHLKSLVAAVVALRYVGPLFIKEAITPEGLEITSISSVPPAGFWAALYGIQNFRDGFGNYFLHSGRQTLSSLPIREDLVGIHATRVGLNAYPGSSVTPVPLPVGLLPEGVLVHEDVIDGNIVGPRIGWALHAGQDWNLHNHMLGKIPTLLLPYGNSVDSFPNGVDSYPRQSSHIEKVLQPEYTDENPPTNNTPEELDHELGSERKEHGHVERSDSGVGTIPEEHGCTGMGVGQQECSPDDDHPDGNLASDEHEDCSDGSVGERDCGVEHDLRTAEEESIRRECELPAPDVGD